MQKDVTDAHTVAVKFFRACRLGRTRPLHEDVIGYREDKPEPEPTARLAIALG